MSKFPIIVLDGPDGSGKTTLANKLCEEYGYSYLHLTYRHKDRMFYYHWAALEYCLRLAETRPVVLDRWWPSERVYADVFRGGTKWPMGGRMFDRVAMKHGITYVWCIPSNEKEYFARFERLKSTGREMYESMRGVYEGYAALYNSMATRLDMTHYDLDTHGQDMDGYVQWLIDLTHQIKDAVPNVCDDRLDRRFAGNPWNPSLLLVGDESNSKMRREVWPFFEYGNSSLWITQALDKVGLHEDELAWINIHKNGKVQGRFFGQIYEAIGKPTVVALGHRAASTLNTLGVDHVMVKHPQWNRRFAPDDLREYQELRRISL